MQRHALRNLAIAKFPPWTHPHLRRIEKIAMFSAGNLLRHLPVHSAGRTPPRKVAPSLRDYMREHPEKGTYQELYPEHVSRRIAPRTFSSSELHPAFRNELSREMPSVGVGIMRGGRVISSMGAVITPDHYLIHDVSDSGAGDPHAHPLFSRLRLPEVTRVSGRVAVLTMYQANLPGRPYYSHWLWDLLPRLHLLERSGVHWDKLVVPRIARYHRESLELLGLGAESLITEQDLNIEASELVVPSLVGHPVGNYPAWACQWLQERFLPLTPPAAPSQPRRIYISRAKSGRRHILNEDELLAALAPLGFKRVFLEDHSFIDGVRLLRDAEAVVTPHGSNVANIVFCRKGTPVIEIFSPKFVVSCHWTLACHLGLDYGYILGNGRITRTHSNIAHIVVDPQHVLGMLHAMMSSGRSARATATA